MAIDKEISEKRKRQCSKLIELSKDVVREAFEKFGGILLNPLSVKTWVI